MLSGCLSPQYSYGSSQTGLPCGAGLHIPAAAAGRALRSVGIEYANEARCGEELTVRWGQAGDDWYLTGEADKCVFRLRLGYAPEE